MEQPDRLAWFFFSYFKPEKREGNNANKKKNRGIERKKRGMKCCCTWKAAATSARP